MFTPARLVKRGALVLAAMALITAAAALTPRRADAQVPFGSCFLQPVTVVEPVVTRTGFAVLRPVTMAVMPAAESVTQLPAVDVSISAMFGMC